MNKSGMKKIIAGISSLCMIASAMPIVDIAAETASGTVYGDSNCDGNVDLSDAVLIMQYSANPDQYGLGKAVGITEQGLDNADVNDRGNGITNMDALSIQKFKLGIITELPESWSTQQPDPVGDITYIHLKNTSIEVEGDYAEAAGTTVTISHSGSFYIDGTLDDGQIVVDIPDKTADAETVKLFLNGVDITGRSAPAILVSNAENTSVNLVDGTENFISDGDTAYSGDYLGAAVIEAKDDITVKGGDLGTGSLTVTANTQDGIVCNNDIKITGGVLTVNTLNSNDKTDAVKGKTSVTVKGGTLNIDAEGDGIKSSKGNVDISGGEISVKAGNDAVQAETAINISGGVLTAGGDRGLTAVGALNITGGQVVATATDDQTDVSLMTGTTQATMLLNCIDCAENTDLMWKKSVDLTNITLAGANSIEIKPFVKKYKYILVSDPDLSAGGEYQLESLNRSVVFTYDNGAQTYFNKADTVAVYENVDPAPQSSIVPPTDTTGYTITLASSGISTNAPAETASASNGVCTITQPGIFAVTGSMAGGQIVVNVDKTAYPAGVVELDLMGVDLTNETAAPIYVEAIGDEVRIAAKSGTVNTISDGTSHSDTYTDSDGNVNTVDAAIFSRDDLKIKGTGALTVNGNSADGIVSKNDLKIYNGTITVNAVDDGIRGKDSVTIGNDEDTDFSTLDLTVNTDAGDGIKATATDTGADKSYGIITVNGGTVNVNSYLDGFQAEQEFVMNGGDVTIKTYQGSSYTGNGSTGSTGSWGGFGGGFGGGMSDGNTNKTDVSAKGIKAVGSYDETGTTWQSAGNITINGGTLDIDSSDDCIHAGGNIDLIGGLLKLASADDGVHCDHDLVIGSGSENTFDDIQILVSTAYEGIEGVNITQNSGTVIVNSTDDAYNAAGGADGSGNTSQGPWGQGGWGGGFGGGMSSGGDYMLTFNGGFALANVTDGDHDGFDSNGDIAVNGGYVITNGNEPFDCGDSGNSCTYNGGVVVENIGNVNSMGAGMSTNFQASVSAQAGTRITLVDQNNTVIVSFIAGKKVSSIKAALENTNGVAVFTGGELNGSTYFRTIDETQLAAYGGTLIGGSNFS